MDGRGKNFPPHHHQAHTKSSQSLSQPQSQSQSAQQSGQILLGHHSELSQPGSSISPNLGPGPVVSFGPNPSAHQSRPASQAATRAKTPGPQDLDAERSLSRLSQHSHAQYSQKAGKLGVKPVSSGKGASVLLPLACVICLTLILLMASIGAMLTALLMVRDLGSIKVR